MRSLNVPEMDHCWTGRWYSAYRAVFGAYLLAHFWSLIGWGRELFSTEGMLPQATLSPIAHAFPNVLAWWDSPLGVSAVLTLGMTASFLFAIGCLDRVGAVVAWYCWACLFGRNPLIGNPSIPYVGWLLLAHLVVPTRPSGSLHALYAGVNEHWHLPKRLFAAAWIVMALAYSYSGYTKLMSPSWHDGTAFAHVLANPLARPGWLNHFMLGLPPWTLVAATYGAVALELLYAPLALVRPLRPVIWVSMVLMHVGLITLVDFADLTAGMLVMHLFTFNPGWVQRTFISRRHLNALHT